MPPMWRRCPLLWSFFALAGSACLVGKATAEMLSALLPDGVPGYDTAAGVTVRTRLHPEQMPLGLRDGPLVVKPRLDQSIGYDSNVLSGPHPQGSWQLGIAPSLALLSAADGHSIGAVLSLDNRRYLSAPAQNRTDVSLASGARIQLGQDTVTVAVAHIERHEDRGGPGTLPSDRPVHFRVDDIRIDDTLRRGPWRLTPALELSRWTYDPTTIDARPVVQSYRDRMVLQAGVSVRYEVAPLREVLFVVQGLGQDYPHVTPGQANPASRAARVLAGISDQSDPVWHWRVLVGEEFRTFQAAAYPAQRTLIAEAGLTWQPTELTTITALFSRETDAAAQEGVSGMVYSAGRVAVDHELRRDIVLSAMLGWQRQDYFQGGYQTGLRLGLAATWVLNRMTRLSATYDQVDLQGSQQVGGLLSPNVNRGMGLMTVRLEL